MSTFLVTGVAGFIGSAIARRLLARGETVRGFDNFATGNRATVEPLQDNDRFEFVFGDIREPSAVADAVRDVDHVLHQAAIPSVVRSISDPALVTHTNCTGTARLLIAATDAGVETIVVASSSAVYGSSAVTPKHERLPPEPGSPYALSKYYTEQLAVQADEYYDLETVALRYFNVFGPRQDPHSEYAAVVPRFIDRMAAETRPIVFGDGTQSRDFVYLDNVVDANLAAVEADVSGEVFNVGTGQSHALTDLVDELNAILGTDLEPQYVDPRPGDVARSEADISKARNALGYEPTVGFRDGLERTVEWTRAG